jgi:acetolactate decarboxylase
VDPLDHHLVAALHTVVVARGDEGGQDDDGDGPTEAFQTSSIAALLDGRYDGELTVGELLAHGDHGIGTVDHLDGELVVIDGEAFVVRADGSVRIVASGETTPFAVVARLAGAPAHGVGAAVGFDAVTAVLDAAIGDAEPVAAVRLDGLFPRARVRSVARQEPPFLPLREVVGHQSEWTLEPVEGSLVGFRFPVEAEGLEVPGWHLHLISADRLRGGHVIDVDLDHGHLRSVGAHELHVELPPGVHLDRTDRAAEIAAVEGRPPLPTS